MFRSSGFQKSGTGRAGGSGKQPKCPGTNAGPARLPIAPCLHLGDFVHINKFVHQRTGDEIPTALEVIVSVPARDTRRAAAGRELSQPRRGFPVLLCAPAARCLHRRKATLTRTYQQPRTGKHSAFSANGDFNMHIN